MICDLFLMPAMFLPGHINNYHCQVMLKNPFLAVFAAGVNQSPSAEWPWSLETTLRKWVNEVKVSSTSLMTLIIRETGTWFTQFPNLHHKTSELQLYTKQYGIIFSSHSAFSKISLPEFLCHPSRWMKRILALQFYLQLFQNDCTLFLLTHYKLHVGN